MQFIQPNALHRACLSVGKDDGFTDQVRSRASVLTQKAHGASSMALLVPVEPSRLGCSNAPQRSLSQRSASGMIDGDCSSNSRRRSICVLRLCESSGSSFRNARSLSPISRAIARLCLGFMSMRLCITKARSGKKAPTLIPQLSRLRARLAILNGTGDRRFWLSARALPLEQRAPQ